MSRVVVLDSGPLGLLTNPAASSESARCNRWLEDLTTTGVIVVLPEIVDYELRRELLMGNRTQALRRLDALKAATQFVPITSQTMLRAAEFWASVRRQGKPTADNKALDIDVILAAQAALLREVGDEVVVAT